MKTNIQPAVLMFVRFFIFVVVSFVSAPNSAQAESRERLTGTTQVERELRWGWKYLKNVVDSCLESKTDCQDSETRKILSELQLYLPDFASSEAERWASLLKFVPETSGSFTSQDGDPHRLAVTGFKKFSDVMINTDRMNRPLEEWIGILAHEAAHHLDYKDDAARRLDLVAAEITNHFKRRQSVSTLAPFQRATARNLVFNPSASGLSIGFFSADEGTFDIEWGPTPVAQLCPMGSNVRRQFVGNPVWTIQYMNKKTGVVTLRGGGFVNVMCRPKGTRGAEDSGHRAFLGATLDLQYSAPLGLATWRKETPTILIKRAQIGASTALADAMFGPNQSFWVKSVQHENPKVNAGQIWTTTVVVKSADGFAPQTCELYLSGSQWPHAKHINLPAVDMFNTCAITSLGSDEYRLTATYKFPLDAQPDSFYVPLIRFPSPQGDRYAFPQTPVYVELANPSAQSPVVVKSFEIKSLPGSAPLETAAQMFDLPLTNSYHIASGQKFRVELDIEGTQNLSDFQVEVDLSSLRPSGDRFPIFANGPVGDFKMIFTDVQIVKSTTGSKVLIDVVLPESISGYPIAAMKFTRIYFKAADFSYGEYEDAIESNAVVVNSKYAK